MLTYLSSRSVIVILHFILTKYQNIEWNIYFFIFKKKVSVFFFIRAKGIIYSMKFASFFLSPFSFIPP